MKKASSGPDYGPEYQRLHTTSKPSDLEAQQGGQPSRCVPSCLQLPAKDVAAHGRSTITAGVLYIISSSALTLLNKKVLVHYGFTAVHALLAYHCLVAVALVKACAWAGAVTLEPLTRDVVWLWLPVNFIFVGMLATNFYALQLVGVGMVSILKNLANLFIILGDWACFSRTYTWHVWLCLALMTGSVVTGGATDVNFSAAGYTWQMVNNVFTAAYALYLSHVTGKLAGAGSSSQPNPSGAYHPPRKVNQMSMCYYNNLLSLPLLLAICTLNGELFTLGQQDALRNTSFQAFATLGAVLGFCLSWSSIWFVSLTTATLYTLTGSCNKVLVAAAGIWLFGESTEPRNLASIAVGLGAGALLPFVKMRSSGTTSSSSSSCAASKQ
jgi:GDP-mannose transporter